jgi:FtsP/CotA-like multicopper oxidase with cupredoxin domain
LLSPDQLYFSGIYSNYANSPLPNPNDPANCAAPNFCGIRKFVDSLPGLNASNDLGQMIPVAVPDTKTFPNSDYYEISLVQYKERMHADLPATQLRGYVQTNRGTDATGLNTIAPAPVHYLGPLILAQTNRPVRIKFINTLPSIANGGNLFIPVDQTVLGAGMGSAKGDAAYLENRATLHLQGSNTPWISDGTPHQWTVPVDDFATTYPRGDSTSVVPDMFFNQNGTVIPQCSATVTGNCSGGATNQLPSGATNDPGPGAMAFYYSNQQSARLMFYHDESFGITRLNVYAGEAAGYLLTDNVEADLVNGTNVSGANPRLVTAIPSLEIPLVIQDKTWVPQNPTSTNIYSVGVLSPGSGYRSPVVSFAGGCTMEPSAKASVGQVISPTGSVINGGITGIYLTFAGSGCTSNPVVTITDMRGTGKGAVAFASIASLSQQDPTWDTALWGSQGNLWYPHVYMPNQWPGNPDGSGINPMGRWDYGTWFDPKVTNAARSQISCATTSNPGMMCPGVPTPINPAPATDLSGRPFLGQGSIASITPEAFMDTPLVNGTVYPTLTVSPQAYRFRILSAGNDRTLNLSLFVACGTGGYTPGPDAVCPPPTVAGINPGTEVAMVPAIPTSGFPANWPVDGRPEGVPDPNAAGPSWTVIGNDGGLLPAPVVVPPAPINFGSNPLPGDNPISTSLNLMPGERADVIVDFSRYAGKTLILYNDAPAAYPSADPRYDYFTGDEDLSGIGGAPTTLAGFGPNTRTIMQIKVSTGSPVPFDITPLQTALPAAFKASQPVPVVPESVYSAAYGTPMSDKFATTSSESLNFTPIGGTSSVTMSYNSKSINDGFDPDFGRANVTLGTELPSGGTPTPINFSYADPFTEDIYDSAGVSGQPVGTLGDGSQIWAVYHNGVDSHAIHFHLSNVQLLNRMAISSGAVIPPAPYEQGWKDTVRMNPNEVAFVAMRPMSQTTPFPVPDSMRLFDVTMPAGTDWQMSPVGPTNQPSSQANSAVPMGWEYLWQGEQEGMMREQVFQVPPQTPANLTAAGIANAVNVSFTDMSLSESGFTLQRADDSAFTQNLLVIPLPANPGWNVPVNYQDSTAVTGKPYYYRVQTFKPDAEYWNTSGAALPNLVSPWTSPQAVQFGSMVSANPQELDFGSQAYRIPSAVLTLTFTNSGGQTDNLTHAIINGVNATDFSFTYDCTATLAPGASCHIFITFTPLDLGLRVANFELRSTDSINPTIEVPITGTGLLPLTITASSTTVPYGSAVPVITPTVVGLSGMDTVASLGTITCSTTYTQTSSVAAGPYPTTCSGAVNSSYSITYVAGSLTVTPLVASVTVDAATKAYGQTDPVFTSTLSGFVPTDNVTAAYSRIGGENVGTYAISATLSPAAVLTNYNISYNSALLTITKISASVTPTAATKVYGQADPAFSGTLSGFLPADAVTATYSRIAGENVGTYAISATLSPSSVLTNYDITSNTALLTISKVAASVTTIAATKVYGQADPTLTGTLSGFLPADNVTASYSRVAGENVGAYTISASLSPAGMLSNYDIAYNTASLTIAHLAATVTPTASSKLWGAADPTLSGTLTGFLPGITATWTRTQGENVGSYPITATLNASPTILANYTITTNTALFKINQAPAAMTFPAPGSQLAGSTQTFTWNTGGVVTTYELWVGTTGVASHNLYGYGVRSSNLSATVTNLPTTGVTVYVRLNTTINGVIQFYDYTFMATGAVSPSVLTAPTLNSHLTSTTATFAWSPGSGVTRNELRIGTTGVGSWNIYGYGVTQTGGTVTVSGMPATGVTVYVQLISVINGVIQSNNYTFTAFGTTAPSVLTVPLNSSTFTSTSVTFNWDAGSGVTRNELWIGTTGVGSRNIYGYGIAQTGGTVTVNGLPTGKVKVYVTLVSIINGASQTNSYTFTSM